MRTSLSVSIPFEVMEALKRESEQSGLSIGKIAAQRIIDGSHTITEVAKPKARGAKRLNNKGIVVKTNFATGARLVEKDGEILEDDESCPKGYIKCYAGGCTHYDDCKSSIRIDTEAGE